MRAFRCLSAAAAIVGFSMGASAQEVRLAPLEGAWLSGEQQALQFPLRTQQQFGQGGVGVFSTEQWKSLTVPDAATLAWLSSKIPGLDAANVRLVDAGSADNVMRKAVNARVTYMEVLSNEGFRHKELYYVPKDVLAGLDARYISGTIPIRGVAEDGKPFQMVGFLIGQSRVEMLFERDFSWKQDGRRYKLTANGRVAGRVLGDGDLGIDGVSAYGAPIFCPWARLQRLTKQSANKLRVQTSCKTLDNVDIDPVRAR